MFVVDNKTNIDQFWVVESTEHIFKGDRDVLELLRGRKTGFSSKKEVYFFFEVNSFFKENLVFLPLRRSGTSRSPLKMCSVDSTTQS